jgi:hypothetical protein
VHSVHKSAARRDIAGRRNPLMIGFLSGFPAPARRFTFSLIGLL